MGSVLRGAATDTEGLVRSPIRSARPNPCGMAADRARSD